MRIERTGSRGRRWLYTAMSAAAALLVGGVAAGNMMADVGQARDGSASSAALPPGAERITRSNDIFYDQFDDCQMCHGSIYHVVVPCPRAEYVDCRTYYDPNGNRLGGRSDSNRYVVYGPTHHGFPELNYQMQ